ncbi:hypothetical protein AAHH17_12480 [Lysinibacillus capsici]|uniref:hypothetical protein n=1 Tax=Lysinibacillus capsici TaxID=2115968 RepID=UPI0032E4957D
MVIANVLFDNNGNFIWVSITALAAVITIFINTYIANKTSKANFKANIVAKSRIEWIQEVRKYSADFIASCYDLAELLSIQEYEQNEDLESEKEIARLMTEVTKNGNLLMLYFGPDSNKTNEIIIVIIKGLVDTLTNKKVWESQTLKDPTYDLNQLMALRDFLRIYFKAEWKRANGELKNSKVQDYLTQNKVFRNIRNIYINDVEKREREALKYYEFLAEENK